MLVVLRLVRPLQDEVLGLLLVVLVLVFWVVAVAAE
jgi:hypothetical protein